MDAAVGYLTTKTLWTDCMSKLKGNSARMLQMFRERKYQLIAEEDEMEERKEVKQSLLNSEGRAGAL